MTKLLSRDDVKKVLDMSETIDILQKAFGDLASGHAMMPQRTPIAAREYGGVALFMPGYLGSLGALGAKVVTIYKDNPIKHNKPTVMGTIILLDQQTGETVAVMDGSYLTAMRTGAAAGLATKFLARKDARVHTMFGTGGMARTHAWAVSCVRDIEKVNVYSIDPISQRRAFADALRDLVKCEVVVTEDPERAVKEADVVTLITSARNPIVDARWFKSGTHINATGAHALSMRELDTETVVSAKVVCDHIDACRAEAGDLSIPVEAGDWSWDRVHGSIGEVILGRIPGRQDDSEITLFKSVGLALQDISTAFHVFTKAVETHTGTEFTF